MTGTLLIKDDLARLELVRLENYIMACFPAERCRILSTMIRQDGVLLGGPQKRFGVDKSVFPIEEASMFLLVMAARIRGTPFPATRVPDSILEKVGAIRRPITRDTRLTVRQILAVLMTYPEDKFPQRLAYEASLIKRLDYEFDPFSQEDLTCSRVMMLYSKFFHTPMTVHDLRDYYQAPVQIDDDL